MLACDAPGHGDSPGRRSSLPRFIAALDAVIERFGAPQALVGHSLGALAISCRHAGAAPAWSQQLEATVLVSTPSGATFLLRSFTALLGIAGTTHRRLMARFEREFRALPEHYEALPGLQNMHGRLMLVHDDSDDLIPWSHSQALQSHHPVATLLTTSGFGHSALTRDTATIAVMVEFIDSAPPRHPA